ncbi:hypothetical protein CEE37_04875 [candidate division LCP-89 bacterium B3_LCP]|uniref:Cytochrome c domain-containing protein n=1 Tax=candidate division LCP-89 bacterium B3_LCP TaxID=2012998 RepID=A0A532V1C5_UNCL8|nr:MAG: hypothetical protein CEE37_04875 [candidate division LCP-89 bacterium B3_LCP]
MKYFRGLTVILFIFTLSISGCTDMGDPLSGGSPGGGSTTISYSGDVQPIFDNACVSCHVTPPSPGAGDLDLTSYAGLTDPSGPNNAPEVIPGDADNSYFVKRLDGSIPPIMPVGGTLTPAEIDLIKEWINQGALDN